ncbi:MAG TPA: Gfo/Idh/MocA family oxidoreductase [Candidatus Nanopelagicales bacterium]|nr:Gfo/Idh/MocA family oxidoreductase [Candidatus Nanopelagicales bacterium]
MTDTIRWGVLGAGRIATTFCDDLALLDDHAVVAAGSRREGGADDFAARYDARAHGSWEALVADPDVDVVYVATPHPAHHAATLLALQAGKNVLCEKPFTMDAAQARELIAAAQASGAFLMEAMWTRFLPAIVALREIVAEGRLGELVAVHADFGVGFAEDPESRWFAPELGGGALLDLGVYPVSFASMLLGTPTRVTAVSDPASTGVDGHTSAILQHGGGRQALVSTTMFANTETRAVVVGRDARVEVDSPFFRTHGFTLVYSDDTPERVERPYDGNGMRFEAIEVARCLREGRTESPVMPLAETVTVLETMDEIRRQIGLVYPD